MMSELASTIMDALNSNIYAPCPVDIPTDQDLQVGPLTFRYGGGPKQDRWYSVEPVHPCDIDGKIQHAYEPDILREGFHTCTREGCGLTVLSLNIRLGL